MLCGFHVEQLTFGLWEKLRDKRRGDVHPLCIREDQGGENAPLVHGFRDRRVRSRREPEQ